ncbi:MAG: hypothetical protein WBO44_14565 [Saprospiraceae bacterium]
MQELNQIGRSDILVVLGGIIPEKDFEFLYNQGVIAIFGPGTPVPTAAKTVLLKLLARY